MLRLLRCGVWILLLLRLSSSVAGNMLKGKSHCNNLHSNWWQLLLNYIVRGLSEICMSGKVRTGVFKAAAGR